jgi:hypothetical protein
MIKRALSPLHRTALAAAAVLDHRFPAGAYAANPTGGANQFVPFAPVVVLLEAEVVVIGVWDEEVEEAAAAAAVAR